RRRQEVVDSPLRVAGPPGLRQDVARLDRPRRPQVAGGSRAYCNQRLTACLDLDPAARLNQDHRGRRAVEDAVTCAEVAERPVSDSDRCRALEDDDQAFLAFGVDVQGVPRRMAVGLEREIAPAGLSRSDSLELATRRARRAP